MVLIYECPQSHHAELGHGCDHHACDFILLERVCSTRNISPSSEPRFLLLTAVQDQAVHYVAQPMEQGGIHRPRRALH